MSAGAIVSVGSFDNFVQNSLDGDQKLNKGRHAHTHYKSIYEHYLIKKEST